MWNNFELLVLAQLMLFRFKNQKEQEDYRD